MDYELQIRIKALSEGLNNIDVAKNKINNLNAAAKKTSSGGLGKLAKTLESTGSRVNVLGQRMTGMITLPLALFAKKSIDTAVSVEKSWVRFNKVFSGTEEQVASLTKAGTELSEKFGINVEDVAEVMGEFNKAGIESEDSLKSLTEQALETSILFDTDLKGAFDGVKAIMFGFGKNVKETTDALAAINVVADSTTTSEQDILDVFERSGAIFKLHNIGVTEAAALTSLLAQSNIKGTKAGTAFKTILSKIGDATPKTAKEIAAFGIDIGGTAFRTSSFTDKLRLLNKKQTEVFSSGNKSKIADWNTVLKDLTGIRQGDKFSILVSKIGQLDGVVENASDSIKNLKIWNDQLATVMESSPHKLEIMNEVYRNQAVIIGKELLPYKMELLKFMIKLIEKFNNLSPRTKDWAIKLGILLAVLGPVLAFIGLTMTGLGFLTGAFVSVSAKTGLTSGWLIKLASSMGSATGASTALGSILSGGLLLGAIAITTYLVTKAIFAVIDFKKEMDNMREASVKNREQLDLLQKKVDTLSTDKANEQYQNAIDKANELWKVNDDLQKKYEGWPGVWNAFKDGFEDMSVALTDRFLDAALRVEEARKGFVSALGDKESDMKDWVKKKLGFADGGIVQAFNNGGMVYAANGFLAKGKDTVPAMLSPGEMVLNKSQQSTLFDVLSGKSQMQSAGGPTVNINVGTMVASRGEQREFARRIKTLISENDGRFA